ncbi:UDP-3-O-[3-hydroxymyristoyl] N-acetylglucosamine deacetylase [Gemmobacter megaterium]|uniref:UDP-3-O-acyl-N-acetylglucosamine deacetylase n=1 Tax=Gemmobacter megaterium TaxID=1086013 RepID=A0A1N7P0M4_9RHOB|nr:UDP-3-O-acyl-N-acetylglucosamine deacetylase [Gemmobacter megaterium]SIT04108.1 UDP-3-O-[3-hydroxymyristoyl] N-acetylglucosamine deacetylase [Gemmobacter megaterium]
MGCNVQSSLISAVVFDGVGLHSGAPVRMVVRPAPTDHGVVFLRTDLPVGQARIPARWNAVVPSKLCTLLANSQGATVSTIEHVMAALAGCGISNALIEIDGPEVPILDGSAEPFVRGFLASGVAAQSAPVLAVKVLRAVEVREGEAIARLEPSDSIEMDFTIDFTDAAIGRQEKHLNLSNGTFVRELCDSRTFCRQSDVDAMRASGLALGGTLENAVVVEGDRVLSPGGLRHRDEPVRHKMLDALGDLSLAGGPVLGRYVGVRAGHAMTNRLLRQLFATPGAWAWVECNSLSGGKLPGVGVTPADLPRITA